MKVIIVGNGFIANHLNYTIVSDRLSPDYQIINSFLDKHSPDVVINCIGFCGGPGRNIDGCEENRQQTFDTNTLLPIMLAQACERRDIRVIQIGSGCIYYGKSPQYDSWEDETGHVVVDKGWREDDAASPLSTYSKSKYACDIALGTMKNVTTLRIRMPISWKNEPRNLLAKLINYKQVVEQPNSVTFLRDLSRSLDWAVSREVAGTYHVTSPKPITHSYILNEYRKYWPEHEFTSITPIELNKLVSAPRSNCIIDSSKIMNAGFKFVDQDQELKECIEAFAHAR